jgi:hypothetical protein
VRKQAEAAESLPGIRSIREFKTALDCLRSIKTPAVEPAGKRPNLFATFGGIRKASEKAVDASAR